MTCDFMSFLTIFRSYQDDDRVIKILCNIPVYGLKDCLEIGPLVQQAGAQFFGQSLLP